MPILNDRDGVNANVLKAQYAVRGKIYQAAVDRKKEGKRVIFTNTGNPQALGQKPLTFPRQVLSILTYPALLDLPNVNEIFPSDVQQRARRYLKAIPGGTGAYQDSRGNEAIRQEVSDFLERRDGIPASIDRLFLTDGASRAIQLCLQLIIRDENDGILLPLPQYPLYSATVQLLGGQILSYDLDESKGWQLSIENLKHIVNESRRKGITPRAIVLINPGNPTGQVLSESNLLAIAEFCRKEQLVILADEVYQENVYGTEPFISMRRVLQKSTNQGRDVECFTFHTVSKGVFGECGRRGGFFEALNISESVLAQIVKLLSTTLSSNVDGQVMVGLMVNPPKPSDSSYPLWSKEVDAIFSSLKRRAAMLSRAFDSLPGVSCNFVEGALYAFPNVTLPQAAIDIATKKGLAPDLFYCLELLEDTGICAVPGSGFGQADGSFHFRTTILPPEDEIQEVVDLFSGFHVKFLERFGQ